MVFFYTKYLGHQKPFDLKAAALNDDDSHIQTFDFELNF